MIAHGNPVRGPRALSGAGAISDRFLLFRRRDTEWWAVSDVQVVGVCLCSLQQRPVVTAHHVPHQSLHGNDLHETSLQIFCAHTEFGKRLIVSWPVVGRPGQDELDDFAVEPVEVLGTGVLAAVGR